MSKLAAIGLLGYFLPATIYICLKSNHATNNWKINSTQNVPLKTIAEAAPIAPKNGE